MSDYIGAQVVTLIRGHRHCSTIVNVLGPDDEATAVLASGLILPLQRLFLLQ